MTVRPPEPSCTSSTSSMVRALVARVGGAGSVENRVAGQPDPDDGAGGRGVRHRPAVHLPGSDDAGEGVDRQAVAEGCGGRDVERGETGGTGEGGIRSRACYGLITVPIYLE